MPVRNTACTPAFMMCVPMFNRTLRTVIKSILVANVNHGKLKFNEADYLMVQIRPTIFLKHSLKALFSSLWTLLCLKSFHSNAYLIVLPCHLSISLIFNVEDLTFYRCSFAPLTFSASATGGSASSSLLIAELHPASPSVLNDDEAILEDEIVDTVI